MLETRGPCLRRRPFHLIVALVMDYFDQRIEGSLASLIRPLLRTSNYHVQALIKYNFPCYPLSFRYLILANIIYVPVQIFYSNQGTAHLDARVTWRTWKNLYLGGTGRVHCFPSSNCWAEEFKIKVPQDLSGYDKYPEAGLRAPYRKDEATSGFLVRAILARCSTSVFRMDACPRNFTQEI